MARKATAAPVDQFDLTIPAMIRALDDVHVNTLARVLEHGGSLPPVLVASAGGRLRVVDGQHRITAHLKVYGADAVVPYEIGSWDSEDEMLIEAFTRNDQQGKNLSAHERRTFMILMHERGVPVERLAVITRTGEATVRSYVTEIVFVPRDGAPPDTFAPKSAYRPWRQQAAPFTVSEEQADVMRRTSIPSFSRAARDLYENFQAGLVHDEDHQLAENLRNLLPLAFGWLERYDALHPAAEQPAA